MLRRRMPVALGVDTDKTVVHSRITAVQERQETEKWRGQAQRVIRGGYDAMVGGTHDC